jgi:hypothetical protein
MAKGLKEVRDIDRWAFLWLGFAVDGGRLSISPVAARMGFVWDWRVWVPCSLRPSYAGIGIAS